MDERERADLGMIVDQVGARISGALGASVRFHDGIVLVGVTPEELEVLRAASRLLLEPGRASSLLLLKGHLAVLAEGERPTG